MLCLVDGDIITHRVGYTTEEESIGIAKYRADEMLDGLLRDTDSTEFRIFLSDNSENNFRYKIDPSYKANRTAPKPRHLEDLKEHLIVQWGAKIAYGMEADDALGIHQKKDFSIGPTPVGIGYHKDQTVICSIDKDLLQIPGLHYNFVKKEWKEVGQEEGLLSFYRSILIGDVSDNIKGVYGIGPKKAEKILPKWVSEEDAIKRIHDAYVVWMLKDKVDFDLIQPVDLIRRAGQLLKIKQSEEEPIWDSQWLKQMETVLRPSTPKMVVVSNPSTEPTTPVTMNSDGFSVDGLKTVSI